MRHIEIKICLQNMSMWQILKNISEGSYYSKAEVSVFLSPVAGKY